MAKLPLAEPKGKRLGKKNNFKLYHTEQVSLVCKQLNPTIKVGKKDGKKKDRQMGE